MSPAVLSQSEIDTLLAVAEEGEHLPDGGMPAATLRTARPAAAVKTYDFRRPEKISREQLRTLQAVHEKVGRIVAVRLSSRLRGVVQVRLAATGQMVFDEFANGLKRPTQLVVVSTGGLGGPFLIDLDLDLAFAAVERLLGGPGNPLAERREPTAIESALIRRIVDDLVPGIAEGWAHLCNLDPRVSELALGTALLRIAAPSSVVAVLTFEVRFAGQVGPISLCYPYETLAPVLQGLKATDWPAQAEPAATEQTAREEIARVLGGVEIPVVAALGGIDLSVEQLADLAPGDVIRFEERAGAPIALSVMDQVRASVVPGRIGDRMAVQLVSPLTPVEA